jgi:hypothetical protein
VRSSLRLASTAAPALIPDKWCCLLLTAASATGSRSYASVPSLIDAAWHTLTREAVYDVGLPTYLKNIHKTRTQITTKRQVAHEPLAGRETRVVRAKRDIV